MSYMRNPAGSATGGARDRLAERLNGSNFNANRVAAQDARALARALGGEAHGRNVTAPGPGHSPRDRSLSIRLEPAAPDGFIAHSFADDDWRECRDHVRTALGLSSFTPSSAARTSLPPRRSTIEAARAIWREGGDLCGTLAERYLHSRGIRIEGIPDLRFHGNLRLDGQAVAGLIALMRDIHTNDPTGIHRTFLDGDGRKLDRRMLGRARGAVVKLTPDAEVTQGLGLAEGIETSLAVMQAGWAPVWACLSAGGIAAFPVLPGVVALTVFTDADEAGERAAREACARWRAAEREAVALAPNMAGTDWADWRAA